MILTLYLYYDNSLFNIHLFVQLLNAIWCLRCFTMACHLWWCQIFRDNLAVSKT